VKNPETWNTLKRIPEVLDCWFESGAMPYASKHYPFDFSHPELDSGSWKRKNQFNDSGSSPEWQKDFKFPADFIAEWLDQTRGWFYTLIILSTALFDSPATLNTIVNGIVLAEDGKKMSKSLKNYPDPTKIFDNYWADAMRFYLMNSPVVEAQDLRFSEAWVEEVVKKVILPLWNTYSFFTTYANIDNFKPNQEKNASIYYCRHGQVENNAKKIMNWWEINSLLNKTWINQAIKAWKNFKLSWEKIDIIISSPLQRAKNTAELIAKEIWFEWNIIEDERLIEQYAWIFSWMSHEEIRQYAKKEFWLDLGTIAETREFFKNWKYNKKEDIHDFDNRVSACIKEIKGKYSWKNVLIVAHSWTYRPINKVLNNLSDQEAFYDLPSVPNATIFKMPENRSNMLDKWIISELNKLVLEVSEWLNSYKINEATRPIVTFMDNLTNWYIRRSRKRFWKSENDSDKIEAYETLYEVLVELSKVLSPFMPFVSEYIYRNLTGKESVHLDIFPTANKSFILEWVNANFAITTKLINLWLAAREKNKLRVRQPLQSIKLSEKLDSYYEEILKDELNIKEILYFNKSEMPKKVCKPNARLIWPKFWGDVKFIISEAKAWNFEELEWGKIVIPANAEIYKKDSNNLIDSRVKHEDDNIVTSTECQSGFILEEWEYEIAFESSEGSSNLESWFGMVISLDTNLSEELIQEWLARDLVRHIQESRKEANFEVSDRIQLQITNYEWTIIKDVINNFKDYIESETLSTLVEKIDKVDYEKEIELEDYKILIKLKK